MLLLGSSCFQGIGERVFLVVLIDILRVSLSVNTLLAMQVIMNAKEGQLSIYGRINPRQETGLLGRVINHIDGTLHERMMRRAYLRAAAVASAMRRKND